MEGSQSHATGDRICDSIDLELNTVSSSVPGIRDQHQNRNLELTIRWLPA